MLSPEGEDEEFEFYLKFAKPLVLTLPDTNDRIKAATWIRYLKNDTTNPTLRGNYLKLLLFVLQRRRLFGPFASIPDESKPLENFPDEINIQDVAKNFIEVDKQILKATLERGGYGEWPPYTVACSSDLTQYAASQEIPNFGVQAYLAISRDPLQLWDHHEKAIFPIGESLETTKPESSLETASPDISCFVSSDQGEPAPGSPRVSPRKSPGPKDETPPKGLEDVSPKTPQKPSSPKQVDEFNMEDRVPPTWGSNLMNVKDSPATRESPSPLKELDIQVSDQDMLDFFNDDIDLYEADIDEGASYLQGDSLVTPPKSRSPSPKPPKRSRSMKGMAPKRLFPPDSPGSTPSPVRSRTPPMRDLSTSPRPGTSTTQQPRKTCSAKCPVKSGLRPPRKLRKTPSPQSSPKRQSLTPDKLFDAFEYIADDKDMSDYYDKLSKPSPTTSVKSPSTSPKDSEEEGVAEQPTQETEEPDAELRELEKEVFGEPVELESDVSPGRDVASAVQQILDEMNEPSISVLQSAGKLIEETIMNKSDEGLGGDSFIAPEQRDYRWLSEMPSGPGLPEDEQQDPALWESFGWWTDDPDEIFDYLPPTPRARGSDDPYAAQRERWAADVERTPPIFSRDPRYREGLAAQRQYTIDEFGMESFEEPVWTSAVQYFKYKTEPSPFIDRRMIDRKSYDPADYPTYESPQMTQQFGDIRGPTEEEEFFGAEIAPDLINISMAESDFLPMTKNEAVMEAIRHGPQYLGLRTSTPERSPEEESEGDWEDDRFLEETPPLFMLEPPFLATPPDYEPNPDITVDELEDSIARYIEEDLKIIHAKIPATTPQRSPSPKRPPLYANESPPFLPDIDIEPDPYIPSPELVIPERYEVPEQRQVDWDTEIGSPVKIKQSDAVLIESEENLLERNIKRRNELAVIYEREFESPPKIPSPPPMPHMMDEPVPRRLPPAMAATKLPPSGWDWRTPPKYQREPFVPRRTVTPTGISPPRPVSEDISMYYESPPHELLSPSMAVSSLMFSPPEGFGKTPSPVRSPGGRPVSPSMIAHDEIDMERLYPTKFQEFDSPEFYQSPPGPPILSPDSQAWKDTIEAHKKTRFRDKTFSVRPKPGRSYKITGAKRPSLSTLEETSPRAPARPPSPDQAQLELEAEIAELEAEIFAETSPQPRPGPSTASDLSPDYQRKLRLESLKLHKPVPYTEEQFFKRRYKPTLEPIVSPRAIPVDREKERIDELHQMSYKTARDVLGDMRDLKKYEVDRWPYHNLILEYDDPHRHDELYYNWVRGRPDVTVKTPPPAPESPPPPPHMFDEPIPEGMPSPISALPRGWDWKTPPRYKQKVHIPKEKITPTGISPPRTISRSVSMFFESPPQEVLSPSEAVSSLMYTPPEGFGKTPSPIRSPGGRPIAEESQFSYSEMYSEDFGEDLESAELEDYPYIPESPSPERPKPGRSYKVTRSRERSLSPLKETSPEPARPPSPDQAQLELEAEIAELEAEIFAERSPQPRPGPSTASDLSPEYERRLRLESLKLHKPVPYMKEQFFKRRRHKPTMEPIVSPRAIPVDRRKERIDEMHQMSYKTARDVLGDMRDLKKYEVDRWPYHNLILDYDDPHRHDELYYNWVRGRPDVTVKTPPPAPESPPPPPHMFDEPIPEGMPSPISALPRGWDWKTPPRFKQKVHIPKKKITPTGISPPRTISRSVSMFFESPPQEVLSPSEAVSSLMYTPPEGFGKTPSPIRSPGGRPIAEESQFSYSEMYSEDFGEDLESAELEDYPYIPESPSPESKAWRDRVGAHEKTKFRKKPFVIRPRPGRSYKVTRSREPSLLPLEETSPERARPPSPDQAQLELEAEIAALEAEIFAETSPQPRPGPSTASDLSPEYERKLRLESLKLHKPVPYTNEQFFKRRHKPTLEPIVSPRAIPVDRRKERIDELHQMSYKTARDVLGDMRDLKKLEVDRWPYHNLILEYDDPHRHDELYYNWVRGRPDVTVKTPPPAPESPPPPPHMFDEPIPEGMPSPISALPRGWDWKTPPKYKAKPYVSKKRGTPTGISPPRTISRSVSMFFESPPQEVLSPSEAVSSLMYTPPEGFGKTPSPIRSPGGRPIAEESQFSYSEMYSEDFGEDLESAELEDYPYIPESPSPESKAWRDRVGAHEKTKFRKKPFVIRPRPGRSYKVTRSREPSLLPLEETSPERARPPSPDQAQLELEAEIAALEAEIFAETSPQPRPGPSTASDLSPEYERKLRLGSLKLHKPVPYTNEQFFKRRHKPTLEPIVSPRAIPVDRRKERIDELHQMSYKTARDVLGDMRDLKKLEVDRWPYHNLILEYDDPHRHDELYYNWVRGRPDVTVKTPPPTPPAPVSPAPPPHMFDEPIPEDLPSPISALPRGWDWKTPPKYQQKVHKPKKKVTPTGISPPGAISQSISMFFESPPEEMYSPPPSPIKSPGGRPITEEFTESEMLYSAMYPEDFGEGLESAELEDYSYILESPSPERKAWRDGVGSHEKTKFKKKTFVIRPKPGRSYRVTRSREPSLSTLEETSPIIVSSETDYYTASSAPAPPPRPPTPAMFQPQPRRIPRQRAPLDPNVLYASTPRSAIKRYEPTAERIRFEATRPRPMAPTSPEQAPARGYYETPIPPGIKPWKKRRRPIDKTARKRLTYEDEEMEFEREMIEELEAQISAAGPSRNVLEESPPSADELADVSMLGEVDYEPAEFNLYTDEYTPQYEERPAFEGQPDVDLMDRSPIRRIDRIPYEERDFRWMDGCGTRCPWGRSP